jgi:hypothetical protein
LLRESLDDRMADLVFRATELRSWPGIEKDVSEVAGGEAAIAPLRSVVDA